MVDTCIFHHSTKRTHTCKCLWLLKKIQLLMIIFMCAHLILTKQTLLKYNYILFIIKIIVIMLHYSWQKTSKMNSWWFLWVVHSSLSFFLNYTVLFKSNANKKHKFHLHLRYQPISAVMVLINILAQWRPCLSRSSMKALLKKEQFLVQFEIVSMNAVKCREKMVGSRNALRW